MARDYKHRVHRRRRHSGMSPWLGVLAGLLIGLIVAFGIYIRMQAKPVEQVFVRETLPTPPQQAAAPAKSATATAGKPKKETPAPQRPRFDFYTKLPEIEVEVPEQALTGKTEQGVKQVDQPGTYFLQVGSFRNSDQADSFKAELALLGLETSIQKITIDDKNTWHRVRVGPFSELDALNKARRLLNQRNVESTLIMIKP